MLHVRHLRCNVQFCQPECLRYVGTHYFSRAVRVSNQPERRIEVDLNRLAVTEIDDLPCW